MSIQALHLFHVYLNQTQNWSFNTLIEMPDTDIIVGANRFIDCDFYSDRFRYIKFPLREFKEGNSSRSTALLNRAIRGVRRKMYPRYILNRLKKVDLVHSHFATTGWENITTARYLRAPHIVSFYGYDYERLPRTKPEWRDRYLQLFTEADLFLCEGTHGAKLLAQQGCPKSKIRVSRLGVRSHRITPINRLKKAGELRLVQVAAMTEKKGHVYALKAFLDALDQCPNMTLTFVGSNKAGQPSDINATLHQMVTDANANDRVTFIPSIDFGRLHQFLGEFQAFIHPSVYAADRDSEGGAPIVLLDAQATGMPVLSSEHCDIPDEVIHGSTGLLAPERDTSALSSHIQRFYAMHQAEYDEFARSARRHVEDNYDIRHNALHLRNIYHNFLS